MNRFAEIDKTAKQKGTRRGRKGKRAAG
jgi:hypothetical protein